MQQSEIEVGNQSRSKLVAPQTALNYPENWRELTLLTEDEKFISNTVSNHYITTILNSFSRHSFVYPPKPLFKTLINKNKSSLIFNLNDAEQFTKTFDIISFDFFDTLVIRDIEPPDLIKRKTAEYAYILLLEQGIIVTPSQFQAIRDQLEKKSRKEAHSVYGLDHEISIFDLFQATLEACGVSDINGVAAQILNFEIETELHCLTLQNGALELLRTLFHQGKKLIVVSDMYLRKEDIRRICNYFGISDFISHIFVSSDQRLAKYSGKIYDIVLSELGVSSEKLIHIGDNHHSDFFMPSLKKIKSLWLYQPSNLKRRSLRRASHEKNNLFNFSDKSLTTELQRVVFHTIAPATVAFAYKVLIDANKLGLKNLFFIAREGVFLKEIFEFIQSNVLLFSSLEKINFKILYASRASSICADYCGLQNNQQLIEKTIYRYGRFSVDNFLKTYGIQNKDLSKNSFDSIANLKNVATPQAFFSVLENSAAGKELHDLLTKRATLFTRYLMQLGIGSQPVGLIDVGWRGTIQEHITLAMKKNQLQSKIYGFYLGTNACRDELIQHNYMSKIFAGYVVSECDNDPRTLQMTTAMPLIELCFTDPTLTTTDSYEQNLGIVKPIFAKPSRVLHSSDLHLEIKKAALEYAQQFCVVANNHVIEYSVLRTLVRESFLNLLVHPTKQQAKCFAGALFDFGWGDEKDYPLIRVLPIKNLFKPKAFLNGLRQSGWWQGSLSASGFTYLLPFFNLYIYFRSRHVRISELLKRIFRL